MGKKKKRNQRNKKLEKFFSSLDPALQEFDCEMSKQGAKSKSKLGKKWKKKLKKERETKEKELNKPEAREQGGFHKVTIFVKENVDFDKNFVFASIGNFVDIPFCPLGYFRGSDSLTFYFDSDYEVAEAIRCLNKRIQSPNGELMGIKVLFVKETDFVLNCEQVELVKMVMAQRFDASSGLLNLSCFHMDERFVASNTFVPLSNNRILKQVFLIIKENLSGIRALDLSNNKLSPDALNHMELLESRCPDIWAINLENNFICDDISQLKCLRPFPLKELKLKGNASDGKSRSYPKYVKHVKKCLPFLKMLDGKDLLEEKAKLYPDLISPSPLTALRIGQSSLADRKPEPTETITEERLKTFLEQYYSIVDSPNKEALLQAYVPNAKIELKSENSLISSKVFEGQDAIKEFLLSWPPSRHDHSSFNLEVLSLLPHEGVTRVQGVFYFSESETPFRFRRTMKIDPYNSGFCCSSDLLEIQ